MKIEDQIAQLLQVAEWRITHCETIVSYAMKHEKKDFNPSSDIDNFYKNVCVMSFDDAVLIIGSLLSGENDNRPISFWNWKEFLKENEIKLRSSKGLFELKGLQAIRDQIIAHQDKNNSTNTFPDARIRGYIDPSYIVSARNILLDLIYLFISHMKKTGTPYSSQFFNNITAKQQIDTVMNSAKPILTDNHVI